MIDDSIRFYSLAPWQPVLDKGTGHETRLAETPKATLITRISDTSSKVPAPDPISKGGADGGAVGAVLLDFCRKKQGATGITTVAPYVAGQLGQGG
jgi:hypothetical protein